MKEIECLKLFLEDTKIIETNIMFQNYFEEHKIIETNIIFQN